jgi:hypothetical protein
VTIDRWRARSADREVSASRFAETSRLSIFAKEYSIYSRKLGWR